MLRSRARIALPEEALNALGNPERRRLVKALGKGPKSVAELAAGGSISRPAVSRHLAQLERAGLVVHHGYGTRNIYALNPAGLEQTVSWLNSFWDDATARLKLLAENSTRGRRDR
jgi:DNA-binding transcriptional ArsR family regulator